uniref:Uncharacterized protein n=1 Tax=Pithovirus LCPAC406 TaxID=2506599 RepID=A0A481ZD76_9VIRU|nr:MAG: uncharacterized protein LCPAC406_02170 [Pithovirus LCPAC406]
MSVKRGSENEMRSNKDAKKMKIGVERYVSKNNGLIDKIYTNKKLICFLYEQQSNLIKIDDIKDGAITDVTGIDEFYCYVKYRQFTGEKKCDRYGKCCEKIFAEPEWKYFDCNNKKIFSISTVAWNAQEHEAKQWAFAIDPIVMRYVETMNPLDLIISTVAEDEKMVMFKQGSTTVCVKMKKDSNSFQLC